MVTFKPLPDFPKYALTSNGRILHNTGHGLRKAVVRKDKSGFRYVILSNGEIEKKMFLLALKFPRGEGYENVLRLKKKGGGETKETETEGPQTGTAPQEFKRTTKISAKI